MSEQVRCLSVIDGHNVFNIEFSQPGQTEDVCYYRSFDARCPQQKVVLMEHALFGRMDSRKCYNDFHDQDFSHCTTDVLSLSDQMCSGKQTCSISIPNEDFHAAMSCSINGYFEASYQCLPGEFSRHFFT